MASAKAFGYFNSPKIPLSPLGAIFQQENKDMVV